MRLLGIDFETSGLSPTDDFITEVGAVLWDTEASSPLKIVSRLLNWNLEKLDPVITELTGITVEMLSEFGEDPGLVFQEVEGMAWAGVSAFVAHNGNAFDNPFYQNWGNRLGLSTSTLPWIDTMIDVPYPESVKTRKLPHIAADHGFLNPFAHRAVFDVLTMFKVLEKYDIEQVLALSQEPAVYLRAEVSYENRTLASARGYRWVPEMRMWCRSFKESQLEREISECGFRVTRINKPKAA